MVLDHSAIMWAHAALFLAMSLNGGKPLRDDVLNLSAYSHWAARAEDARDKALRLAMMTASSPPSNCWRRMKIRSHCRRMRLSS